MAGTTELREALYGTLTTYQKWLEAEGLDVIKGVFVDDLRTVLLKPWKRKGAMGVYINLEGAGDSDDAYVCEIPAGGTLNSEKHLFEELVFILSGRGATEIWNEGGRKQTFEWQEGSLFAVPLNAWHRHCNRREDQPTRYLAVTGAPTVMDLFHSIDFVFNCDYTFTDRYDGEQDYFSGEGTFYPDERVAEINFIPDVKSFQMFDCQERGAGSTNVMFELANNIMAAHISEFPATSYKKAHRHGPGAHVVILSGKGYTLMWKEGEQKQRFDWHEGSMIVPPDRWFHQHFNTGKEPARYLGLRTVGSSLKFHTGRQFAAHSDRLYDSFKLGGDLIEYEDEDPKVRELFVAELAKEGLQMQNASS